MESEGDEICIDGYYHLNGSCGRQMNRKKAEELIKSAVSEYNNGLAMYMLTYFTPGNYHDYWHRQAFETKHPLVIGIMKMAHKRYKHITGYTYLEYGEGIDAITKFAEKGNTYAQYLLAIEYLQKYPIKTYNTLKQSWKWMLKAHKNFFIEASRVEFDDYYPVRKEENTQNAVIHFTLCFKRLKILPKDIIKLLVKYILNTQNEKCWLLEIIRQ
jgi:hypothetical protein